MAADEMSFDSLQDKMQILRVRTVLLLGEFQVEGFASFLEEVRELVN